MTTETETMTTETETMTTETETMTTALRDLGVTVRRQGDPEGSASIEAERARVEQRVFGASPRLGDIVTISSYSGRGEIVALGTDARGVWLRVLWDDGEQTYPEADQVTTVVPAAPLPRPQITSAHALASAAGHEWAAAPLEALVDLTAAEIAARTRSARDGEHAGIERPVVVDAVIHHRSGRGTICWTVARDGAATVTVRCRRTHDFLTAVLVRLMAACVQLAQRVQVRIVEDWTHDDDMAERTDHAYTED